MWEVEFCCICKDELVVPVEIICMPCHHDNYLNCSTLTRICLWCAIHYLQLYLSPSDRDYSKKCLYCSHRVRLSTLTITNSFRIDFTMIRMILHHYPFTFLWECPFCFEYKAIPFDLIRHIMNECHDYYFECPCEKTIIRRHIESHRLQCKLYEQCPMCFEYLFKSKMVQHMKMTHNCVVCKSCQHYIDFSKLSDHIRYRCPFREIQCTLCLDSVKEIYMETHLQTHRQDVENKLLLLQQQQQDCQRQLKEILQKLLIHGHRLLITE